MMSHLLLTLFTFSIIEATIDIDLAEYQYLADHLHPEECRKLVAALHFTSYEKPKLLDQAEAKVSKDIPCIRLLLHWNSAVGEGKGETHEAVQHRLRQIGREDLADWLGKTVFHELGVEMMRNINDSFGDIINNNTQNATHVAQPTFQTPVDPNWDPTEWIAFDTICWILLIGLSLLTVGVLAKVICLINVKSWKAKRIHNKKQYDELTTYENSDTSESEDRFDIRSSENTSIKLKKIARDKGHKP